MYLLLSKVSQLVILHEESESGIPIPDLSIPIRAVGAAVQHLVAVSTHIFRNLSLVHFVISYTWSLEPPLIKKQIDGLFSFWRM